MTSKEIIRAVIRHQEKPRLGLGFDNPLYSDIVYAEPIRLINKAPAEYQSFGDHEELKKMAGFHGEVMQDVYGNIYGRLGGKTKGECVHGRLEDGWEQLKDYRFPEIDPERVREVKAKNLKNSDKYVLSYLPCSVFSILRDLRKMDNALMDTVMEPEMLKEYMDKFVPFALEQIHIAADCGVDGIIICDDWGMQFSPFISPSSFREIFKPVYKKMTDACHERDIDFMLHSCGCVLPLVDDMVEAGIDVFQFDQPEAVGSRFWAENYGKKVAFFCPIDIQKVMPTGDREYIEKTALEMVRAFKENGGSLIVKDYPNWQDINVEREWAHWARKVILDNSDL